jgi:hypothetical protein
MTLLEFPTGNGPVFVDPDQVASVHPVYNEPGSAVINMRLGNNYVTPISSREVYERLTARMPTREEMSELRDMHSQLVQLNVERQRMIETLADVVHDLYVVARVHMTGPAWEPLKGRFAAAMELAGRKPEV